MSITLNEMCRTCMTKASEMMPIWPAEEDSNTVTSSIATMLRSFTIFGASFGDGMPENICLNCTGEMIQAYTFKQKCERSESTLRSYLNLKKVRNEMNSQVVTISPPINNKKTINKIILNEEIEPENYTDSNADIISCIELSNTESHSTQEEIIEDENSKSKVMYQCVNCLAGFCSSAEIENHLLSEHEAEFHERNEINNPSTSETVSYKCEICVIEFTQRQSFDDHCQLHVIDNSEEHLEEVESVIESDGHYTESTKMENNITVANQSEQTNQITIVYEDNAETIENIQNPDESLPKISNTKFYCSHCNGEFAKQRSLFLHFNSKKCMEQSFQCDICQRVFVKKRYLLRHINSVHTSSNKADDQEDVERASVTKEPQKSHTRKYKCTLCPKTFTMSSTLKDHMRIHNCEKPFLCSICGKGFTQNSNLKQHLMRHNNLKSFKCTECTSSFVTKGELTAHERKHSGAHPFICDVCGSGFTTSSALVKHRRIHTGERPYACDFCPLRFTASGTLKNHRRTHTGERPFRCKLCNRSFSQRTDCVSHIRIHTGERPYKCKHCNLSFQTTSSFRFHMRKHKKSNSPLLADVDAVEIDDVELSGNENK